MRRKARTKFHMDFKDRDGNWVLRWRDPAGGFMQTRLGALHNSLTQRTRAGSRMQAVNRSYIGVEISDTFLDPQKFCNWVVSQKGWEEGFDLDKDLFAVPGKRIYSEETCVFLPHRLNVSISTTRVKVKDDAFVERRTKLVRELAEEYKDRIEPRAYQKLMEWEPEHD